MQDLKGKVAVITGAASGIGYAVAERFVAEGLKVVLADVDDAALARATDRLRSRGATVLAARTDVSRGEDVEALARQTLAEFGAVDVLFNNAGVLALESSWETTVADWQWLLGVNLWGVIHGIRVFVPIMLRQGTPGHIVNTGSSAGLTTGAFMGAYNVSKHGVVALSENLYRELMTIGAPIGVSVLCPGLVKTQLFDSDRNRPAALQNESTAGRHPAAQALEGSFRDSLTTRAVTPAAVADAVLAAIRENHFYIFTHADTKDAVRRRLAGILEDRPPAL